MNRIRNPLYRLASVGWTCLCLWLLAKLVFFSTSTGAFAQRPEVGRPPQYPPTWPQFITSSWADPRTVTIKRSGAGADRPAEFIVLELVNRGSELRILHEAKLRNPFGPWSAVLAGNGRFLITLDDRWIDDRSSWWPEAKTDNCLVVYDFVRGSSVARKAVDFLPVGHSANWYGPGFAMDPLRNIVYLSDPSECRRLGRSFVVVDLLSATVRVSGTAPDKLPDGVVEPGRTGDLSAILWDWSSGESGEPSWTTPSQKPQYLRGVPQGTGVSEFELLGLPREVMVFKLDPTSRTYTRVSEDKWVPRVAAEAKPDGSMPEPGSKPKKK